MNTEPTNKNIAPTAGWICYDGECAFCLRWIRRVEKPLTRQGFGFVPLQTPWIKERLNLSDAALLEEMKLVLPDERILGGADAAVILARHVWWLWPLLLVGKIPGTMPAIRACYRVMARNRYCSTDGCANVKGETP